MSISQIVILSAVCAAFVVFAVVLAWGDYQTRKISHSGADRPQAPGPQLQSLRTATAAPSAPARSPKMAASAK